MATSKDDPGKDGEERRASSRQSFVDKVVKDPNQPPDALLLFGYLGKSSEPECIRLYFNAQLNDYVDIPNDAIFHEEASGPDAPLEGTYVWINRDAQLVHGPMGGTRRKARFLEGRMQQDFAAQAAGNAPAPAAPFTVITCPTPCQVVTQPPQICGLTHIPPCPQTIAPPCPHTVAPPCVHTVTPPCPTVLPPCPHTIAPPCVHTVTPPCPTVLPPCPHTFAPPCVHTVLPPCPQTIRPPCPHTIAPPCLHTFFPPCQHTVNPPCLITATPACLPQSIACPSFAGCPTIQCGGGGPGGLGGPL
jgi:hypothetical protein